MPSKANEKLQSEMTKNKTDSYIQVVGGFLLDYLDKNPQDADKILDADKTIGKSFEAMRKEAERKQDKRSAMFSPQEGFDIVMKYFGINAAAPEFIGPVQELRQPPAAPKPTTNDFNVNLDEWL